MVETFTARGEGLASWRESILKQRGASILLRLEVVKVVRTVLVWGKDRSIARVYLKTANPQGSPLWYEVSPLAARGFTSVCEIEWCFTRAAQQSQGFVYINQTRGFRVGFTRGLVLQTQTRMWSISRSWGAGWSETVLKRRMKASRCEGGTSPLQ